MPYPNEHAARQRDPNEFEKDSFRRSTLNFPKGISAIIGRLKGETTTTIQSLRFDRSLWTPERVRAWLKSHGFKTSIEVATNKSFWDGVI